MSTPPPASRPVDLPKQGKAVASSENTGAPAVGQPAATPQQVKKVLKMLAQRYPAAKCALNYHTPFQLLVATVLSAQTTDARVNTVTPELFRQFPAPAELAGATQEEVAAVVRSLGFQNRRAQQLRGLAAALLTEHGGEVPDTRAELMRLPGVGRKTAHVVLGNVFDHPAITVDTHVGRLARRLGWTTETGPRPVEDDIAARVPRELWTITCHRLIAHGREICHSRHPQCGKCPLAQWCPSAGLP